MIATQTQFNDVARELEALRATNRKLTRMGNAKEEFALKSKMLQTMADHLAWLEASVLRQNRGQGSLDTVLMMEKNLLGYLEQN